MTRYGTVALFGRSNVGKSTFLNAALGEKLAIVSPLPQTTRDPLLGLLKREEGTIALLDTPGIHAPKSELGRRMNVSALETVRQADVVVLFTDIALLLNHRTRRGKETLPREGSLVHREELPLLAEIKPTQPCLLVINKVDLLSDKRWILPLLEQYQKAYNFRTIIPVSCLKHDDVENVLDAITAELPEGQSPFDNDEFTDRPLRYFAAEYIREQVMLATHGEVPHAVAVSVDAYRDLGSSVMITAAIHVEKDGQKRILIGKGGQGIRDIGIAARKRLEPLVGKKIHLELFVKANPKWKDMPRQLAELGYGTTEDSSKTESAAAHLKQGGKR